MAGPNGVIIFSSLASLELTLMSGITVYAFELPTTGSLSFVDHFSNGSDVYTSHVSDATQARANLRAVLKESKHTDGDKDFLRLVKARPPPPPQTTIKWTPLYYR